MFENDIPSHSFALAIGDLCRPCCANSDPRIAKHLQTLSNYTENGMTVKRLVNISYAYSDAG